MWMEDSRNRSLCTEKFVFFERPLSDLKPPPNPLLRKAGESGAS